jgi:hypothetical protein
MLIRVLVLTIRQGLQGQLSCPFLPKQRRGFFSEKRGQEHCPCIKVEEAKCGLQSTRPIRLHLGLIILRGTNYWLAAGEASQGHIFFYQPNYLPGLHPRLGENPSVSFNPIY